MQTYTINAFYNNSGGCRGYAFCRKNDALGRFTFGTTSFKNYASSYTDL